ncbi:MAG: ATP-binding protein [Dehalococcoidia bacterium]
MTFKSDATLDLMTVFENAPIAMILVDRERRVRLANRAVADNVHCLENELIGLRSGEVLKCVYADAVSPGSSFESGCESCIVRNTILDTFQTNEKHDRVLAPIKVNRDDGVDTLHVLLSTIPIDTADEKLVLVCMEDVTELSLIEEELRRSEEIYALAQRAANIGSWNWNIVTGELEWSAMIERMFGFNTGEFEGTYEAFLQCVHPEDRKYVEDSVNAALEKNEAYNIEHRIVWPDRTVRWVSETGDVFREETGQPLHMIGIVQDITDRKKVDHIKDEFIGLVSHELRSPLTVIIGAINTVLSEWEQLSEDEMKDLISDASLEAESLSHLIGNLVELSRSRADRLIIYPEPADIRDIVESAVDSVKKQYPSHHFELDFAAGIPLVRVDQLRIERIFYNLLENAAKYSAENSEVRVTAKQEGDNLVIGVSDQGEGISPGEQGALFDSFHRLQKHEKSGITGSGLGLSVCRALTEAHGGRIWVESKPGKGTTFFFSMPWQ